MSDAHLARTRRILDKLREARGRGVSCFGSEKHHFRLNPALSEAELRRFEAAHAIELPGCYRAFLQHAGNGGAGPYYGVYPLDKWDDAADWVLDGTPCWPLPADFLARPCPLHPGQNNDVGTAPAEALAVYQGTLSLGTQGCTFMMLLIVSGPYRGKVAYVDVGGGPSYVVRDHDFLAWYERWLDELLNGYTTSWFGYGPAGGETELLAILADAGSDDELKGEAAGNLCRLPRLSDTAAAQMLPYLEHPLAAVRASVCRAVGKFAISHGLERVAQRLADPAASVRDRAVHTLIDLDPERWTGAVMQVMRRDTDADVAYSAFARLKGAGKLTKPDVLQIIETTRLDRLRQGAISSLDWSNEDRDLAVRLLGDPAREIRLSTVIGLRQTKVQLPASALIDCLEREEDANAVGHLLKMLAELAGPAAADALLKRASSGDDFHRLDTVEGLIAMGEERVAEIAGAMLQENRPPVRSDDNGFMVMSHRDTISTLVRKMLRASPSKSLRKLAGA